MNWTRLDNEGEAKACEVPGLGCFVKFYSGGTCFVPNARIELDNGLGTLKPFATTQLTFSTTEGTSTMNWIGDAGDKLDAKLAKLERKKHRGKAEVDPVAVTALFESKKVKKNKPARYSKIVNKRVGKKVVATRVRG